MFSLCSDFIMRLPKPWRAERTPSGFKIVAADDQEIAFLYVASPDERLGPGLREKLPPELARRVAAAIVRVPELITEVRSIKRSELAPDLSDP